MKKLTEHWIKDYVISFFAGLVGALVIVFALDSQAKLNNNALVIWGLIFFFTGILCVKIALGFPELKKLNTKIPNYILFVTFGLWVIYGNARNCPYITAYLNGFSPTAYYISLISGILIGLVGIILIYRALIKMWKPIYWIFLSVGALELIIYYLFVNKIFLDYLMIILIIVPTIISSFLILKHHKFPKKSRK